MSGADRDARSGARLGPALAIVLGDPVLWVLGAAGFLARGGFLVLALPIWTLPTAVEISTLLGPDAFGATGLAPRGVVLALAAGAVVLSVIVLALLVSAAVDVASWDRLTGNAEWAEGDAAEATGSAGRGHDLARVVDLAGVALICLLPALGGCVVVAVALGYAIWAEIVMPGALEVPLAIRVAARAVPAFATLALALAIGELLHGLASRRVLDAAGRPAARARWPVLGSLAYALRHPVRPLATAAAGWVVAAAALAPGIVSISVCWALVRSTYRNFGSLGVEDAPALLAATALFVVVWLAALLVAGVASAVRAAAWSTLHGGIAARAVAGVSDAGVPTSDAQAAR